MAQVLLLTCWATLVCESRLRTECQYRVRMAHCGRQMNQITPGSKSLQTVFASMSTGQGTVWATGVAAAQA